MKKLSLRALMMTAVVIMVSNAAFAGLIISPVSATATLPTETTYPNCTIDKIIDQSGLYIPFSSGVTSYSAYMSQNPQHHPTFKDDCYSSENNYFGNGVIIDVDLGAVYNVEHMVIWNGNVNAGNSDSGIKDTDILLSENADFSNAVTFSLVIDAADNPIDPYVIDFPAAVSARYVRMDVSTNHGNLGHYNVSEVAFDIVPEPLSLLLIGMGGLFVIRNKAK